MHKAMNLMVGQNNQPRKKNNKPKQINSKLMKLEYFNNDPSRSAFWIGNSVPKYVLTWEPTNFVCRGYDPYI